MTSLVKKKMKWLAFKILIHIFTIVHVEWRDVLNTCNIQLII